MVKKQGAKGDPKILMGGVSRLGRNPSSTMEWWNRKTNWQHGNKPYDRLERWLMVGMLDQKDIWVFVQFKSGASLFNRTRYLKWRGKWQLCR